VTIVIDVCIINVFSLSASLSPSLS